MFKHECLDTCSFGCLISYMHVFCIFVFAPVQRNWACFIWKGALEIRSSLLLSSSLSLLLLLMLTVPQGRIRWDSYKCYYTQIQTEDHICCLTHSQYTDTGQTSPSTDPIAPVGWWGSHQSNNAHWYGSTGQRVQFSCQALTAAVSIS